MTPGLGIIVFHGLPASGKSTLAAALCAVEPALGLLSIDQACAEAALPAGTSDEIAAVYEAVLARAATLVHDGRGAVIDATFWQCAFRARLYARTADLAARCTLVNVMTPFAVCCARTAARVTSAASPPHAIEIERRFRLVANGGSRMDASELARFDGVVDVDGSSALPQLLSARLDPDLAAVFACALSHLENRSR